MNAESSTKIMKISTHKNYPSYRMCACVVSTYICVIVLRRTFTQPAPVQQLQTPAPVEPAPPQPKLTDVDDVEDEEEEEGGDTFDLAITVAHPKKVGDGMSAYIAYDVTTTTSMPSFKSSETTVLRRFSDFLGLHSRLSEKYLAEGRIVPPAPEKSVVGMTKVKFSKSEDGGFIERRRAALER